MNNLNPAAPKALPVFSDYVPTYYYMIRNIYVCDHCGKHVNTLGPTVNVLGRHKNGDPNDVMSIPLGKMVERYMMQFACGLEAATAALPLLPMRTKNSTHPIHHPYCDECMPTQLGDAESTSYPFIPNPANVVPSQNLDPETLLLVKGGKTSKKIKAAARLEARHKEQLKTVPLTKLLDLL